jgi:hypothetical protein
MAKAPDPVAVAAMIAEEEARQAAAEIRKIRESVVVWLILDGERRVLRYLDITARQAGQLRAAGWTVDAVFRGLSDGAGSLDMFAAGWWLAGAQAGISVDIDGVLDIKYNDAPGIRWPTDEELATDEAGDDNPPA